MSKTREMGEAAGHALAEDASAKTDEMMGRARAAGAAAWDKVNDVYDTAREKAVRGARVADQTIREKPYHALGVAFGVGLILGLLLKRSRSSE